MHREKHWNIAPPSEAAGQLADALKTSPLIAQLLINRGLSDCDDCRRFLSPSLHHLHDPDQIPAIPRAAERIAQAIRDRQKIVIYGDYDVDGITATAILWHAVQLLGGQVDFYIPHRLEEGYGLNADAIRQICDAGANLIITVDCGITAVHEAAVAAERGVDLIITDHHECRHSPGDPAHPLLPQCHTIVHPRLTRDGQPSPYPNPSLCGAGVAFKLAWAVGRAAEGSARVGDAFKWFLVEATALAALGTIADVVPLCGENRILAHFGLGGLKQSRLTGIRALIESAGLTGQRLDSYHVGFLLAPRLNACGRMGHARQAVEMLTRADQTQAGEIARYLEQQNRLRQGIERQILDEALQQVEQLGYHADHCRGVVLAADGWHAGVIGIVASRIVNRLNKPTVMVAMSNGHGQGSARSIPGFHLARALNHCRDHLEACGGHEMAAGLRLQTPRFEQFRQAFFDYCAREVSDRMLIPELRIDSIADLRQITVPLVTDLARLGPFGVGNHRPLLCCHDVELVAVPRCVGRTAEHLQMLVRQNGATMRCIAFNKADWLARLPAGARVDLAVEPIINDYSGQRSVELQVREIRLATSHKETR